MHAAMRIALGIAAPLSLAISAHVSAQISTELIEQRRADFEKQATDPDMKREGGTQSRDWPYDLPPGVTTRLVTFYVDGGTALHGKLFLPREFSPKGRWPGVVVGHGINAISIGIENTRRALRSAGSSRWRSTIRVTASATAARTTSGCWSRIPPPTRMRS